MLQLIFFIIFLISSLAVVFILYRKIPALAELPKNGHHGFKKHDLIVMAENKFKDIYFHWFGKQMLIHKILSFVKVWTLRAERKIDDLLGDIRKKAQELDKKRKNNIL